MFMYVHVCVYRTHSPNLFEIKYETHPSILGSTWVFSSYIHCTLFFFVKKNTLLVQPRSTKSDSNTLIWSKMKVTREAWRSLSQWKAKKLPKISLCQRMLTVTSTTKEEQSKTMRSKSCIRPDNLGALKWTKDLRSWLHQRCLVFSFFEEKRVFEDWKKKKQEHSTPKERKKESANMSKHVNTNRTKISTKTVRNDWLWFVFHAIGYHPHDQSYFFNRLKWGIF